MALYIYQLALHVFDLKMFPDLPPQTFDVIYADPPWDYKGQLQHAGPGSDDTGGSIRHYPTLTLADLKQLRVASIAARDALLFMWTTNPHLDQAIELGKSWGFAWATVAFVWDKMRVNPGFYTLSQCELCLVFKRGKIPTPRGARNVRQFVRSQRGKHSEKPLEVRRRIDAMFPDARKIELFARPQEPSDGWSLWGIDVNKKQQEDKEFRFIDLFAGIGGMRRPFESIGGRCVFTAEWDKFSRQTYSANFPEAADSDHVFAEDVRPYADAPETIPPHDLLLAGFPCQPFSIAGVSKKNALGRPHGFLCDTQGTLFYDLAKIIDHHRPSAFLLENVKNLERHDRGKTFATIIHVLEIELGYRVFHKVISSAPWVPQKRERIFIVGFKDHSIDFDFNQLAIPEGDGPTLGTILDERVDPKYTLTEHLWDYLQAYKEKHRKAGNGFGFSLFGPDDVARTLSARYYKDGSEILIDQGEGTRPRRLTPRECARLMGFDKPGQAEWKIPVSDLQAYRQFGNAVVVPVVDAIARLMQRKIVWGY